MKSLKQLPIERQKIIDLDNLFILDRQDMDCTRLIDSCRIALVRSKRRTAIRTDRHQTKIATGNLSS